MSEDFEKRSKLQVKRTQLAIRKEFNKLNKFIYVEVKRSEKETSCAMRDLNHHHLMQYKKLKIVLLIMSLTAFFLAGMVFQSILSVINIEQILN
ncbi:hypothetical protein AAEU30_16500 [Pseudoalteromonas sp. ZZD1]